MPTNNTPPAASGTSFSDDTVLRPALLGTADWNAEWIALQDARRKNDGAAFWNKRSRDFDQPDQMSPYVRSFLDMMQIDEGDSILDMGCGTGSIAVPLALGGHNVTAADFSESMIEETKRRANAAHTNLVRSVVMSWEDDWSAFGIEPKSVDVVLASRSLAVRDLQAALDKMTNTARIRCFATMSCGESPRIDARVLAACGLDATHGRDYQYAFTILTNKGLFPECRFIYSMRKDTFDTPEEAYADFERMIDDVAHLHTANQIDQARLRLRTWLDDNLVENEDEGRPSEKGYLEKHLRLAEPRVVPWAFLSWSV